ncbi:MAG: N-acetyltransferase family protein [Balneolaceae bacterium]
MNLTFRFMEADDWNDVAEIYQQGLNTGNATFQQEVPSLEEWDPAHLKTCRLIAETNGETAGWAALTSVSGRCAYAGVAEISIYVADRHRGKKVGKQLLAKLITESEKEGIWTLEAGIFPENTASIKIHEALGFRKVGYREKIGKMNGRWRDTILLERRSSSTGID